MINLHHNEYKKVKKSKHKKKTKTKARLNKDSQMQWKTRSIGKKLQNSLNSQSKIANFSWLQDQNNNNLIKSTGICMYVYVHICCIHIHILIYIHILIHNITFELTLEKQFDGQRSFNRLQANPTQLQIWRCCEPHSQSWGQLSCGTRGKAPRNLFAL